MKVRSEYFARWSIVAVFAIAMAWVESAVVFYLRTFINRIEPAQPDPLPLAGGFATVEVTREFATMVMLLLVGVLAGKTWRGRIGYAAVAFGIWDIFYYVFLKVICGWPHSLLEWDVLFLIPLPWWGPVLAPMLISLLMIAWGTLAAGSDFSPRPARSSGASWAVAAIGMGLALWVFMADTIPAASRGEEAVRHILPSAFHWPLFCLALVCMAAPAAHLLAQALWRTRVGSSISAPLPQSTVFDPIAPDPR